METINSSKASISESGNYLTYKEWKLYDHIAKIFGIILAITSK